MTPLPHQTRLLPVVIAPPAVFEIANAASAYDATRPGLGREFLAEIRGAAVRIEEFPLSCPEVHPGVRRALTHRFPFGVLYRVTPEAVQILAVLPTMADPISMLRRAVTVAQ
ncbi:MAG: type II toxin-antitoxin system RelE/ParE family toxin [Phycisphaeraceae bacterium]|nr:type II toxin-antitoxin system RelE/ParE family toxin [Phycisphaeraceae bacterium]